MLEDEATWLRHRLLRMRTLMRFAKEPNIVAGLKELIIDGEQRLEAILQQQVKEPQR